MTRPRYEYRIAVDGEYQHYLRLRDVEEAAENLHVIGVQVRIEHRLIDEPEVGEWAPLKWEDTVAGRLGYEKFPGYSDPAAGESGE